MGNPHTNFQRRKQAHLRQIRGYNHRRSRERVVELRGTQELDVKSAKTREAPKSDGGNDRRFAVGKKERNYKGHWLGRSQP